MKSAYPKGHAASCSLGIAGYAACIWWKHHTDWGMRMTGMIFQTALVRRTVTGIFPAFCETEMEEKHGAVCQSGG